MQHILHKIKNMYCEIWAPFSSVFKLRQAQRAEVTTELLDLGPQGPTKSYWFYTKNWPSPILLLALTGNPNSTTITTTFPLSPFQ